MLHLLTSTPSRVELLSTLAVLSLCPYLEPQPFPLAIPLVLTRLPSCVLIAPSTFSRSLARCCSSRHPRLCWNTLLSPRPLSLSHPPSFFPTMSTPTRPFMILYTPRRKVFAYHSGGHSPANKMRPCLVTEIVGNIMRLAPCLTARQNTKVILILTFLVQHNLYRCHADESLVMERRRFRTARPSPSCRQSTGLAPPAASFQTRQLEAYVVLRMVSRRRGVDFDEHLQEAESSEEGRGD